MLFRSAIAPQNEAKTFWTGSSDGRVCQWDGVAREIDGQTPQNKVAGLAKGKHLAVVSWDDKLRLADAGTIVGIVATNGSPQGVAHAGDYIVVATHTGLSVYQQDKEVSNLATGFSATSIAATQGIVAVGGDDSALHIFTLAGGKLTKKESLSQASQVSTLSFSPDGRLAAGFANGKITVFNESWQPDITRWSSHTARITGIAWTRDGKFAASSSLDCSVRVWSVAKPGSRIAAMGAHKESATGVVWLDDGSKHKLVSTGADGAVKVWEVDGLA